MATNMKLAGLEDCCIVHVETLDGIKPGYEGQVVETPQEEGRTYRLEHTVRVRGPQGILKVAGARITRDFTDAQKARRTRLNVLLSEFPGDSGMRPEDDLERFVCVLDYHGRERATVADVQQAVFTWGDTFADCAREAAGLVLDAYLPVGLYDLDTGRKIDLHVSNPIITPSEDQGATVNELNADEVIDSEKWVADKFDHVSDSVSMVADVDPENSEAFQQKLRDAADAFGLNFFQVKAERIVQMKVQS